MFETIPAVVMTVLENNDLLVYASSVRPSKHGAVLHVGAMFPHAKNKWDPLDAEENADLRADVTKQLRKLGYKAKVRSFVFPDTGDKDVNDFLIKVLLHVGEDVTKKFVAKLKRIGAKARKARKLVAKRERLADMI